MKKVLFLIPNLMHGGAEKVLVNLVNNLDKSKFDVTVGTLFDCGENKADLLPDVHYYSVYKKQFRGNSHYFKLFSRRMLYKKFVKGNYDIVVSYLEGVTARAVSGCNDENINKVSWIHIEQKDKKTLAQSFRSYRECADAYNSFDLNVCVSYAVKEDFTSLIKLDTRCAVLYNTIENEKIKKLSKEPIEFIYDKEKINLTVVGKLAENKGCMRILKSLKRLKNSGVDVYTVTFLGIGSIENKMKKYVSDNDLSENVRLLGYKTNPHKYVSRSDALLCASYAEGFSTSATEAVIVGTPVLTVNVSGMAELIGESGCGVIVDNTDEKLYNMLKYYSDKKELLVSMRENALNRAKIFSLENTVKEVEDMLESL